MRLFRAFVILSYAAFVAGVLLCLGALVAPPALLEARRVSVAGFAGVALASVGLAGLGIALQCDITASLAEAGLGAALRMFVRRELGLPGSYAWHRVPALVQFLLGRWYRLPIFLIPEAVCVLWAIVILTVIGSE